LELIVSIAILSVGIILVLEALSFSARVTGLSADIINAVFLAEDKMQELDSKEKNGLIVKEPVLVEDKSGKFNWKYTLEWSTDLNLYKLNFSTSWARQNREEELTLNTYLRK
jgi:hypothetical protein